MDSQGPLPQQPAAKKVYSAPKLVDIGAIEQIALGGVGSVRENAAMTNKMKHP
jgi:hypothetical protein